MVKYYLIVRIRNYRKLGLKLIGFFSGKIMHYSYRIK